MKDENTGPLIIGGLNAFGAALYGIGIPKDSILKYETSLKSDKFLLIVHGTLEEVEKAKKILETANCIESSLHCAHPSSTGSGNREMPRSL